MKTLLILISALCILGCDGFKSEDQKISELRCPVTLSSYAPRDRGNFPRAMLSGSRGNVVTLSGQKADAFGKNYKMGDIVINCYENGEVKEVKQVDTYEETY